MLVKPKHGTDPSLNRCCSPKATVTGLVDVELRGGCCGQLMTDTNANNGLHEPLPANDYYSALCITQLVTHVPLIHAFVPGLHPCIVISHDEGFSMWRRAFFFHL